MPPLLHPPANETGPPSATAYSPCVPATPLPTPPASPAPPPSSPASLRAAGSPTVRRSTRQRLSAPSAEILLRSRTPHTPSLGPAARCSDASRSHLWPGPSTPTCTSHTRDCPQPLPLPGSSRFVVRSLPCPYPDRRLVSDESAAMRAIAPGSTARTPRHPPA